MAAMMDMDTDTVKNQFNSGFILVKPTNCSIGVWRMTRATMSADPAFEFNDQSALYHAIRKTIGDW